uniref:Immune-related, lectin-like receptor 4 n=1 Tax=Maylandia zebra TaxID=106582 RepID=A0A3P9DKC5_9CICH
MPEAEIVYSDVKFKRGTMETKGELIYLCTYELYLICIQLNIIGDPCSKCEEGWEHHGGKCYYFSTNKSSWTESRDDCRAKGGDLVKIDSREEQEFLRKEVRRIMKDHEDKFWIGLTDSAEQGRWLWVDGSPLNESLSYWNYKEPDNWREDDCVMMGDKGDRYQKSWSDTSCKVSRRSICEKPAAK